LGSRLNQKLNSCRGGGTAHVAVSTRHCA
jgi:hypothetical protein